MSPATQISAADVQKLRQTTGAGMMDCKKALQDAAGDMEKAIKLLRERGIAKSSKRSDKEAGEGLVTYWISDDKKKGIIFELNSETDFVARNEEFVALAQSLLNQIKDNPNWNSVDQLPQEGIQSFSGKIGEKIQARRFDRMEVPNGNVTCYIHAGSKLGVMVEIESDKDVSSNQAIQELGKELALQIAGGNPSYVRKEEVPSDVIEKEKDITKKQMEGQKKPPEILEKIALGKLNQFYAQHCLLDQPHVRDSAGKTKVSDLVQQVAKKEGVTLKVTRFVRYRVGSN